MTRQKVSLLTVIIDSALLDHLLKSFHSTGRNALCSYHSPCARPSECPSSSLLSPTEPSGLCAAGNPSSAHPFQTHTYSSECSCSAGLFSFSDTSNSSEGGSLPLACLSALKYPHSCPLSFLSLSCSFSLRHSSHSIFLLSWLIF